MKALNRQKRVLCPFCAHYVPVCGLGWLYLIENMVGTAGFEPTTSTV